MKTQSLFLFPKLATILFASTLVWTACGGRSLPIAGNVDHLGSCGGDDTPPPTTPPVPAPPNFNGGVTDRRVIVETAVQLPPAGGSFIDPDFRTKIIRVTDARAQGVTHCFHGYSTIPAMNLDSTRLLVACGNVPQLYRFDPRADQVEYEAPVVADGQMRINWESAIWSTRSPDILYTLATVPGQRAYTRLYRVDVSQSGTGRFTLLHDFAGAWPDAFTLWQLSMSDDENVFSFHARNTSNQYYRSGAYIRNGDRFVAFADTSSTFDVDETYINKQGRTIVLFGKGANTFTNKVWDPIGNRVVDTMVNNATYKVGGHYDLGGSLMLNTDRYETGILARSWDQLTAPRNVLQYLRPDNSRNWTIAEHISMRNADESYFLVSTYGQLDRNWPAFQREIILVRSDGSGFSRVAHTRSAGTADSYWSQPRAVIDHNGRHVVFTSDHGTANDDVYILKLPQ